MKLAKIKHPVAIQLHAVLLKLTAINGPKKYPPIAPNKSAIIHSDIPIRALSDSGPILLVERNLNIGGAKKWSADCQTAEAIMKNIRLSIFMFVYFFNIAYWDEDNIDIF